MSLDAGLIHRLLQTACVSPDAKTIPILAPFTGGHLLDLPLSDEADVDSAMATLRHGQRAWAETPLRERKRVMLRFHDLLMARRDEGLDIAQWETGKARGDAMIELLDVCITARHYARDAERLLRPRRHRGVFPGAVGVLQLQHPKGVVGFLTPWNYPITLAASDAIPALLAGNAALIKPDVQTSLSALWVIDVLHEAGVPTNVVQVVTGEGPVVGPMVTDRVDYVMFTGSTRVGREIAARCGERLIGCSLELGGKNAMIIRADADINRAAEIAVRACFSNSGQLCISMERMYINEKIYDAFVEKFVARTRAMRMHAEVGWGADMGSLISQKQLDTVTEHVRDALAKGARALVGGKARPDIGPYFFEPTILDGVTRDMTACITETFGPVVSLYKVQNDEEAIDRANDTEYGLNASVLTQDTKHGRKVAARLKAGTVNVNEGYGSAWGTTSAPMGGMGASGIGRRHGTEGLLKYTESQTVAVQRLVHLGPQFGMDDEKWSHFMITSLRLMKKMGMS